MPQPADQPGVIGRLCGVLTGKTTLDVIVAQGSAAPGGVGTVLLQKLPPPPPKPTPEFYIVQGKEFSRVKDLTNNCSASYFKLHPKCQGGKFYLACNILDVPTNYHHNYFYIIFDDNTCLRVPSMCETDFISEKSMQFELHQECRNGLYYFGTNGYFYIVKQVHSHWGLRYHRTTDLKTDVNCETVEIHGSVVDFLPGGLAHRIGSMSGRWSLLQKISDNTEQAQSTVVNMKVGFDKETCLKILNSMDEDKALSLLKAQLSLLPHYGGCSVDCSEKGWWTEIARTEKIPSRESIYIWQYVHGAGECNILYHQEIAFTDSDIPPKSGIKLHYT